MGDQATLQLVERLEGSHVNVECPRTPWLWAAVVVRTAFGAGRPGASKGSFKGSPGHWKVMEHGGLLWGRVVGGTRLDASITWILLSGARSGRVAAP